MADFRYELLKGVPFINGQVEGKTLKFVGHFVIDAGSLMNLLGLFEWCMHPARLIISVE